MATKINFYDLRDKIRNLKGVDKDVLERAFIAGLQVIAEHLIEEKVVKGKRTPENVLIAAWEISGRQRNEFGRAFVTKQAVTRALVECFGLKISSSETIMYSFKHKSNPVTPLAAAGMIAIEKDIFFIDNLLAQHKEEVEKRVLTEETKEPEPERETKKKKDDIDLTPYLGRGTDWPIDKNDQFWVNAIDVAGGFDVSTQKEYDKETMFRYCKSIILRTGKRNHKHKEILKYFDDAGLLNN